MQKVSKRSKKFVLSILLPVRNEGINIHLMLKILEAVLDIPHEVLIVYDDPKDDTLPAIYAIKKKLNNIQAIHNVRGKGVINAIKTGVAKARGKYILILAVDDVGPTLAIEDMVTLMESGCEFISCTRYKHGGRRLGGSLLESILSQIGNRIFSSLCGSAFSDSTTGFKMFNKNIFDKIALESNPIGWAVVFEMAIKAQAAGLKLGEVPIISIDRLYGGKSSFIFYAWFREYMRWFLFGVRHLHKNPQYKRTRVRVPKATIS